MCIPELNFDRTMKSNSSFLFQAFHSAVKKFEENESAGVKGAAKVPLQGRGTASPWGLGVGVSGHFEAKYGLF